MKRAVLVAAARGGGPAGRGERPVADRRSGRDRRLFDRRVAAAATQVRGLRRLKAGVRFYLEGAWARARTTRPMRSAPPILTAACGSDRDVRRAAVHARQGPGRHPGGPVPHAVRDRQPQRPRLFRISSSAADSLRRLLRAVEHVSRARRRRGRGRAAAVCGSEPGRARRCRRRRRGGPGSTPSFGCRAIAARGSSASATSERSPTQPASFARGRAEFTGVDVRWMHDGVLVRGEWITGQPFDGTTTDGWYADVMLHRAAMGPVTAVLRVERLDYNTDRRSLRCTNAVDGRARRSACHAG